MDPKTLEFYQTRSEEWAARMPNEWAPELDGFLDLLPTDARILELGCGDGRDSARMIARGFDVETSDGSPEMARMASQKLGREVPVMRFDELEAMEDYDAVWAHATLLHVKRADLPGILRRIHRALKPGGIHFANFKGDSQGDEEGHRDEFGRYYNYMSEAALQAAYADAGDWQSLQTEPFAAGTFEGGTIPWVRVYARR